MGAVYGLDFEAYGFGVTTLDSVSKCRRIIGNVSGVFFPINDY